MFVLQSEKLGKNENNIEDIRIRYALPKELSVVLKVPALKTDTQIRPQLDVSGEVQYEYDCLSKQEKKKNDRLLLLTLVVMTIRQYGK